MRNWIKKLFGIDRLETCLTDTLSKLAYIEEHKLSKEQAESIILRHMGQLKEFVTPPAPAPRKEPTKQTHVARTWSSARAKLESLED